MNILQISCWSKILGATFQSQIPVSASQCRVPTGQPIYWSLWILFVRWEIAKEIHPARLALVELLYSQ
jgi:hypothetical protein